MSGSIVVPRAPEVSLGTGLVGGLVAVHPLRWCRGGSGAAGMLGHLGTRGGKDEGTHILVLRSWPTCVVRTMTR